MVEVLVELLIYCVRFLRSEVPNCATILDEIRAGTRSISVTACAYVWLCRLTGGAVLLRVLGGICLAVSAINLILHSRLGWPPFDFQDGHTVYAAVGSVSAPSVVAYHYCQELLIFTIATFVALSLSYDAVARLCRLLVRECCPLAGRSEEASA
jgi:hypothetical protein